MTVRPNIAASGEPAVTDTLIEARAVRLCLLRQLHVAKLAHPPTRRIVDRLRIATAEAMG